MCLHFLSGTCDKSLGRVGYVEILTSSSYTVKHDKMILIPM